MKFPDFIIAGFQKCGTTALWNNLSQHPKLHAPLTPFKDSGWGSSGKELDFFTPDFVDKSESWYQAHFGNAPGLWYDCSPNYAFDPEYSFQRIADTLDSSVKIVFSVRDPIFRAYSAFNHYKDDYPSSHNWGGWDNTKSFLWNHKHTDAFDSKYSEIIKICQKFINPANIHIIIQERLYNKPQEEYDRLFEFLGVETHAIHNCSIHQRDYDKVRPKPDDAVIEELVKYYSPYNEALFELLGFRVEQWL